MGSETRMRPVTTGNRGTRPPLATRATQLGSHSVRDRTSPLGGCPEQQCQGEAQHAGFVMVAGALGISTTSAFEVPLQPGSFPDERRLLLRGRAAFLKQGGVMRIVCAWCNRFMGSKPPEADFRVSHGICKPCAHHFERAAARELAAIQGPCAEAVDDCVDYVCPQHATGAGG